MYRLKRSNNQMASRSYIMSSYLNSINTRYILSDSYRDIHVPDIPDLSQ